MSTSHNTKRKPTSVRLEPATLERLDSMAKATDRSRNYLVNRAVQQFLEYEEWFVQEVRKRLDDAENGRFASPERMAEIFA